MKHIIKTLQTIYVLAACLITLDNLFNNLGGDDRKDLSPHIAVWTFGVVKDEQDSDRNIQVVEYFSVR